MNRTGSCECLYCIRSWQLVYSQTDPWYPNSQLHRNFHCVRQLQFLCSSLLFFWERHKGHTSGFTRWLHYEVASAESKYRLGIGTRITLVTCVLFMFSLKRKHNLAAIQNTAEYSCVLNCWLCEHLLTSQSLGIARLNVFPSL